MVWIVIFCRVGVTITNTIIEGRSENDTIVNGITSFLELDGFSLVNVAIKIRTGKMCWVSYTALLNKL